MEFATWLRETPLSLMVRGTPWVIPMVQVIHLIAIALIIGSALVSNLRLAGILASDVEVGPVLRRHLPWLWAALALSLLTGLIMATGRPDRLIGNPVFAVKLVLLPMAALVTILLPRLYPKGSAKMLALASLSLWIAVIACGHWVAYAA